MSSQRVSLGLGIGWRPQIAAFIRELAEQSPFAELRLGFVEVIAEHVDPGRPPSDLDALRQRGVVVVPHGISLSLGGSEPPERARLEHLARLADRLEAPLVSEHIAFVRAGGLEAGHLLPVPRTRHALDVLAANVREAQKALPVPLALEHVAALIEWPNAEMDEADFVGSLLERTDALLLLDVANLYANAANHGFDALAWLDRIPLERLAYVHVGGGTEQDGLYHDTHAHAVRGPVLDLVEELSARAQPDGAMLERDDLFPPWQELASELTAIAARLQRGANRRRTDANAG